MKRLDLAALLDLATPEALAAEVSARFQAWNCPICNDEMAILRSAELPADRRCYRCQVDASRRPAASAKTREEQLEAAGVPARFRSSFQPRRWPAGSGIIPDSSAWVGEPWACGFLGDSQAGKTFLATELFWRNLKRAGGPAAWVRADRLVGWLFGREGDDGRAKATVALSAKLVCIDDLGWGTQGTSIEALFGFVAHRHAELLPTIWTSNHTNEQLFATMAGQALLRRLQDGVQVSCKGDWRKQVIT